MQYKRVTANYYKNGVETSEHMVFDVLVDADGNLKRIDIFGYAIEYISDKIKWPFVISPRPDIAVLDWGGYDENRTITKVNIFEKQLKVGELFTRFEREGNEEAEYTYKITKIVDMENL